MCSERKQKQAKKIRWKEPLYIIIGYIKSTIYPLE